MKNKNQSYLFILSAVLILVCANHVTAQSTHMNQNIQDHVMLTGNTSGSHQMCSFTRITPDGDSHEFKIPSEKYLVITDVEWQAQNKIISGGLYNGFKLPFQPGDAVWIQIYLSNSTIFSSRTIRIETEGESAGSSEQLTTGFTIGNSRFCGRLRVNSYPLPSNIDGVWLGDFGDGSLILRGYLADKQMK